MGVNEVKGRDKAAVTIQWSPPEILLPVDFDGPLATLIDDSETAKSSEVRSSNIILLRRSLANLAS